MQDEYTSTGNKFWFHPDVLDGLHNGNPKPIVAHIMPTDVCNHKCAFCSVQARGGATLEMDKIVTFVTQLLPLGLKAVILSGGGNPILYKDFNALVEYLHFVGLEVGLITNGMPLTTTGERALWKTVSASTLDKLTWARISCSGLDHDERTVHVPDFDRSKTTVGFSYVYHDIYRVPEEPHHGKVSTQRDLLQLGIQRAVPAVTADSRRDWIQEQILELIRKHSPEYVRLLPNCLEPELIETRCRTLQDLANEINNCVGKTVVFVQYKPPEAPPACYLGYIHPVLNTDGYVYPCDSCVLNDAAGHKFANPWRIARWDTIGEMYSRPVASLVDSQKLCPGCVFTKSNTLLTQVVKSGRFQDHSGPAPKHVNFV